MAEAGTPRLSIAAAQAIEGEPGSNGSLVFIVSLAPITDQAVSVNFATSPGSADGSDFTAASGTLQFAPWMASRTIVVTLTGDEAMESDETFDLSLSSPLNADLTPGSSSAAGSILDDDLSSEIFRNGFEGAPPIE